jgi:hypothetical protein
MPNQRNENIINSHSIFIFLSQLTHSKYKQYNGDKKKHFYGGDSKRKSDRGWILKNHSHDSLVNSKEDQGVNFEVNFEVNFDLFFFFFFLSADLQIVTRPNILIRQISMIAISFKK